MTQSASGTEDVGKEDLVPSTRWTDHLRAAFRDPVVLASSLVLVAVVICAIIPGAVAPHDPHAQSLMLRNLPPGTVNPEGGAPHILGTDPLGRDVLSRMIFGANVSLAVGFFVVAISGTVGVALGILAGYYGGATDHIVMRAVDLWLSFPTLLLAIFILFVLGPGFWNVVLVLAVTRWMVFARVARGLVLSIREVGYVESARAIGCADRRILLRHVLPNALPSLVVLGTIEVSLAILAEGGLAFLGLGIQSPETSWGLMLGQGQDYLTSAWWVVAFPGLAILVTCLSFNLLATTLREFTDP